MPILEIAIPTWNRARKLDSLLASLLPAVAELPIIVSISDNGSTDETDRVIEKFSHHEKLRAKRHMSNVGFDRNVASLIDSRAASYVWFIGDDDEVAVEHLPALVRRLESFPDALWTNIANSSGPSISDRRGWSSESSIDFEQLVQKYGLIGSCGGLAHIVCRSSLLGAPGSYGRLAGCNYLHVFAIAECLAGRRVELFHDPITRVRERTVVETEAYVERWEMTDAGSWDYSVMRQAELFCTWLAASSRNPGPGCFRMYDGMQYPFQLLCLKALANILLSGGSLEMGTRDAVRSLMLAVPNKRFQILEAAADTLRGQSRESDDVRTWWKQYREAGHCEWYRNMD